MFCGPTILRQLAARFITTAAAQNPARICGTLSGIQGTLHASRTVAEKVGIDHRGGDVAVAEELLNGADVLAALEQVRGERVAESVASHSVVQTYRARHS